jgi:glycosyltransferase involved in cell wall biosynthesis
MPAISAFIITKNEAAKIGECLRSLEWVDEIVVVDDSSTDGTAEIAAAAGVRVIDHPFTGFRDQKKFAMDATSNDWVLELDADERVSPEMREAILAFSPGEFARYDAFAFRRLTRFWGKWIRHSSLYPDYKVRLYNKRRGGWSEANIHERFIPAGGVKKLPVDILHPQDLDLPTYAARTARYAGMSALEAHRKGKRASWLDFTLRPLHAFVYRFIIRLGLLDGVHGFIIAVMGGIGTFLKYARLYELQRNAERAQASPE